MSKMYEIDEALLDVQEEIRKVNEGIGSQKLTELIDEIRKARRDIIKYLRED